MTTERFKLIPAVYLILRRENAVLLLKRANTGYQDGNYSLIAGHMDGNELATEALVREAKEEAGITVARADLAMVHSVHRLNREVSGQERIDLFFEATIWQGQITNTEPEKCDDLAWFAVDRLPDNTVPFIKNVLRDIAANIHYSEYANDPA